MVLEKERSTLHLAGKQEVNCFSEHGLTTYETLRNKEEKTLKGRLHTQQKMANGKEFNDLFEGSLSHNVMSEFYHPFKYIILFYFYLILFICTSLSFYSTEPFLWLPVQCFFVISKCVNKVSESLFLMPVLWAPFFLFVLFYSNVLALFTLFYYSSLKTSLV